MKNAVNIPGISPQRANRPRARDPRAEPLLDAYLRYGNKLFLGCFREVEMAIRARGKRIPHDSPQVPRATIRRLLGSGRYRLVDDHGEWRQELHFTHPVAAWSFNRTLRAGGCNTNNV